MNETHFLQPLDAVNVPVVKTLFSGMHRTAARMFMEARENDRAETWFYEALDNRGAFSIISQEDYVVCYAAFEQSPANPDLVEEIDWLVSKAIAQRGKKPLFYNVRGDHHILIHHLRHRGFKEDTTGFELVHDRKPSRPVELITRLEDRAYEPEHFQDYVRLLDGAFNPLLERTGGKTNAFDRGKDSLQERLAARSMSGDFVALWQDEVLVGLYYLTDDVIDVLAVHPGYQNRGFGGVLLRHALYRLLVEHTFPKAYLFVVLANAEAKRMYLRHGFRISGHYSENTYVGINC